MQPTRRACLACALATGLCAGSGRAAAQTSVVRPAAAGIVRGPAVGAPRFATSPSPSPSTSPATGRPALEPARIAGEALAGAYAGIGGYFIGSWIGGGVGDLLNDASDNTRDHVAFIGGVVGAGFATAASVAAIGNIGDQTGSFPTALVGTAAGVAAGILLNQLIYGHARLPSEGESSRMRWVEASLEAMLPSIGATIAFNSTRRYK